MKILTWMIRILVRQTRPNCYCGGQFHRGECRQCGMELARAEYEFN